MTVKKLLFLSLRLSFATTRPRRQERSSTISVDIMNRAIPQTAAAPAENDADDAEPTAPITKEQVREVLKELSRSGYRDAVQNLILSYGVGTFSELPESEYAAILKQAEAIANAA